MKNEQFKIVLAETTENYQRLGKWVAQIKGLPQARIYANNPVEALGKLILTFGRGKFLLPPEELDSQRVPKNAT